MGRPGLCAVLGWAALSIGCGGGVGLSVDLRTDLRAGFEFTSVETLVTRPDASLARRAVVPVTRHEDYVAGGRVADLSDLGTGSYLVTVRLLDLDGNLVASRRASVEVRGDLVITVLVTRDCRGVTCPVVAGSALTECLGGRCVSPACAAGDARMCPAPVCAVDGDCTSAVACAVSRCESGVCIAHANDALCPSGQWCDPGTGCRVIDTPDAGAMDGGRDGGRDGGGHDSGGIDAGPGCVGGGSCSTGHECETGEFACVDGVRRCVSAGFTTGGVCRPTSGAPCDVAESCDGSGPDCPPDGFDSGSECRASTGPCDPAERCRGTGPGCPPDSSAPDGTNCGAMWGELGCGPFSVDTCMGGSCVHDASFRGSSPSCGAIGSLCGFTPACCGGSGYFCVAGRPIYGSSYDCSQCCTPGNCCIGGDPGGPCM